ncbi:sensor histidine kinase [Aphanothece sacrum]|uniref:histidine kinase n=1 Tax=Aphanothece sacrum FPU1 TaxID=1920663 RepID=A0A401IE38_APHSA|nr:ATP-binding protein [Aphanothece sacrum]GBF79430.1 two-component sensor histidine kinase [Aphanothece sacrum FPU1]GBF86645.1 two-component sensor histidine kinase [Aphanothece sacrum FPU3]
MFQGLRFNLLLWYVVVMEIILISFSGGIYFLFTDTLSSQVDKKLVNLANFMAPTLSQVYTQKNQYLEQFELHNLLNSKTDSIEWFDSNKRLLASTGGITVSLNPEPGLSSETMPNFGEIRTVTLFVSIDRSKFNQPALKGYVRISQSLKELEQEKTQLLVNLGFGIFLSLVFVTPCGFWLTQKAVKPVEQSHQQVEQSLKQVEQSHRQVEQSLKQVEQSHQKLKQFTADASHELRNPLTAIKASIDVMLKHPERIHEKDVRKVGVIANSVEHMTNLVKDLLFLARSDGEMSIPERELTKISLNSLLDDLVESLEDLAQQKEITLTYEGFAQLSVRGNRDQLIRLFSNLIQNAINYTPEQGFVMVRLVQHNSSAVVTVEDTGMGITPEQIPLVFERFWRADKARNQRAGGTGLGLSIAQAITNTHQGKIKVSSQVGIGTCFEVSLPAYEL